MPGDNQFVTENFLRLNFSPKPGVTPGTNDTLWLNCDQITARYYVSIAGTTSTGKRWPRQNQLSDSVTLPTVSTGSITAITATTATGSGNVSADGGATVTDRGIQWSIYSNFSVIAGSASAGSGTGSFTAPMTGLSCGTTYYVRAFATNSAGTAYGSYVAVTPTSLNYPYYNFIDEVHDNCNSETIINYSTAVSAASIIYNHTAACGSISAGGNQFRCSSFSAGGQLYSFSTACSLITISEYRIVQSGSTIYIVLLNNGIIQSIETYVP